MINLILSSQVINEKIHSILPSAELLILFYPPKWSMINLSLSFKLWIFNLIVSSQMIND